MRAIYTYGRAISGISQNNGFNAISPYFWMDRDPFSNYLGFIECKDGRRYMFFKRGKIYQQLVGAIKNYLNGDFVDLSLLKLEWIIVLYSMPQKNDDPRLLIITSSSPGTPRIYYSCEGGYLIWSTYCADLLQLKRECGLRDTINVVGLNGYLQFLHQPTASTLSEGVLTLPPASVLDVSGKKLSISQHLLTSKSGNTSMNEKIYEIKSLIDTVITPQIAESGKKTGLFLSGGLDSTLLAGICKNKKIELTTFTAGFEGIKDERAEARAVARHYKTKHKEIILTPAEVPTLLWEVTRHLGFPAGNPSALATYAIIKHAREDKIERLLSGLGSDELFAGHKKHILARYWSFASPFADMARGGSGNLKSLFSSNKDKSDDSLDGRPPKITRYMDFYTFFDDLQLKRLLLPGYRQKGLSFYSKLQRGNFEEEHFMIDIYLWLVDGLIPIITTLAGKYGFELDLPFCRLEFLECAGSIPLKMKVKGMSGKWVLKKAAAGIVPDWVLQRKSQGFTAPIRKWLQGPLAYLLDTYLGNEVIVKRRIFNPDEIRRMIQSHKLGQKDLSLPLWGLISFEVWQRIFIDHEQQVPYSRTY
ncbi:MAG: asparagine synthetase B family protein [bacterium]